MLKPGGRLVYSTCSFNPVENEAVVATALNTNPGQFKLVPQPSETSLPGLKRRPGLTSWKVASANPDKTLNFHQDRDHYVGFIAGHKAILADGVKREAPSESEKNSESWKQGWKEGQEKDKAKMKMKEYSESIWPPANAGELDLEHW